MKRKGLAWLLGALIVVGGALPLLSQDGRTINSVILQGRGWTYSVLQTFSAGLRTHSIRDSDSSAGPSVQLDGSGPRNSGGTGAVNLLQLTSDYTMANPPTVPTLGAPTGISGCLGTKTWQFGVAYYNKGGQTAFSPFTADQTGWATSKNIPVQRPADFPPTATHWSPAYINITDAPSVVKNCTGSGPITAIGTTSVNCACSASGTDVTGQANTTAVRALMQVLDGELRFPSFAVTSPNLMTEGARRLGFGGGFAYFSPDSGTTLFDLLTSNGQSRVVCSTCRYTSVDGALASISDNSISKPYAIYILPGTYVSASLSKSYVRLYGLGPAGAVLFTSVITIGADVTESGISNLRLIAGPAEAPLRATNNTVPISFYVSDSIVGNLSSGNCTIDTVHEALTGFSGITWYSSGTVWNTCWDGIFIGQDSRFVSTGDTFVGDNTNVGAAQNLTMFNTLSDTASYEISGATILMTQAQNVSGSNGVQVFNSLTNAAGGVSRAKIAVTGSRIYVQSTHASTTGVMNILDLSGANSTTIDPQITFTGVDIDMVAAGTTADLIAFNIDADADHDGWNVSMIGGSIRRSGGDTANSYDVDNAETASGFFVDLYGVRHEGKYTGAGTTRIFGSPLTSGVIRNTPLASAPATCSIGDRYTDTSGADCFCSASNTWQITNATGSCA